NVRARELAMFAEEMDQKRARFDFVLLFDPINANADDSFHWICPQPGLPRLARRECNPSFEPINEKLKKSLERDGAKPPVRFGGKGEASFPRSYPQPRPGGLLGLSRSQRGIPAWSSAFRRPLAIRRASRLKAELQLGRCQDEHPSALPGRIQQAAETGARTD